MIAPTKAARYWPVAALALVVVFAVPLIVELQQLSVGGGAQPRGARAKLQRLVLYEF